MTKFNEIKAIISSIEEDATKFYEKANSAAGTRLRKGLLNVRHLCQEVRKEVSEKKAAK